MPTDTDNPQEEKRMQRKPKPSILDPYYDEIKELYEFGLAVTKIRDKINDKLPIKLTRGAYHHFIHNKIKTNQ